MLEQQSLGTVSDSDLFFDGRGILTTIGAVDVPGSQNKPSSENSSLGEARETATDKISKSASYLTDCLEARQIYAQVEEDEATRGRDTAVAERHF